MKLFGVLFVIAIIAISSVNALEYDYVEENPFRLVGDNLYEKGGDIYIKSYKASTDPSSYELVEIYLKRFYYADPGVRPLDKALKDVVDVDSWRQISATFYSDKENLYCFYGQSDGGFLIHFSESNPKKFYFYSKDGTLSIDESTAFFKATSVPLKFSNVNDRSDFIYSTDGKSVFYFCNLVEGADPKTFKLVSPHTGKDSSGTYIHGVKQQRKRS